MLKESSGDFGLIYIFQKYFDFAVDSGMAIEWQLLKYEHIIYHFKACDLEISLMEIVSRDI